MERKKSAEEKYGSEELLQNIVYCELIGN
jgi:hypothetical protein